MARDFKRTYRRTAASFLVGAFCLASGAAFSAALLKAHDDDILLYAAENSNLFLARVALALKADANAMYGWPLAIAAGNGDTEMVKLLMQAGADIDSRENGNALALAAQNGQTEMMELLLTAGADVNSGGGFPLFIATRNDQTKAMEVLIEAGANVNGERYGSPLAWAALQGQIDAMQLLIEAGADVNRHNGRALAWASGYGRGPGSVNKEAMELLLEAGADPSWVLGWARRDGHPEALAILEEAGSRRNAGGMPAAPRPPTL